MSIFLDFSLAYFSESLITKENICISSSIFVYKNLEQDNGAEAGVGSVPRVTGLRGGFVVPREGEGVESLEAQ